VTGTKLIFSIDKLLNRWQVMHYNEQLPFIEIIALKCLKIDNFSQEMGGSGTLGTHPAHAPVITG